MKYIVENDLANFKAWSGGYDTLKELTLEQIEIVEEIITECYEGRELTETNINDFLWFEKDTIAEWLGYNNWEDFINSKNNLNSED